MTELMVALDVPRKEEALRLTDSLQDKVRWFKIGLELFLSTGPDLVKRLKDRGLAVFLDLKFMDIPNTVAGAVQSSCNTGADMLTVHILGGKEMLESAVRSRNECGTATRIMGVTLLTSLDGSIVPWPEYRETSKIVEDLADTGEAVGLDGLVCSGADLSHLSKRFSGHLELLSPGIRFLKGEDDQKRIATPQNAAREGADYIVVGRPIIRAKDPLGEAESFLQAISET